jgi:hypothetical protein
MRFRCPTTLSASPSTWPRNHTTAAASCWSSTSISRASWRVSRGTPARYEPSAGRGEPILLLRRFGGGAPPVERPQRASCEVRRATPTRRSGRSGGLRHDSRMTPPTWTSRPVAWRGSRQGRSSRGLLNGETAQQSAGGARAVAAPRALPRDQAACWPGCSDNQIDHCETRRLLAARSSLRGPALVAGRTGRHWTRAVAARQGTDRAHPVGDSLRRSGADGARPLADERMPLGAAVFLVQCSIQLSEKPYLTPCPGALPSSTLQRARWPSGRRAGPR